jgi:phosphatidylinositol-3-phosphatase
MRLWPFALALCGIASAQVPQSSHVWLITEENHSYEEVVGNASMPYFNSLITKYALASQYYSTQHSSLPALMWLVAGQPVTLDNGTTSCFNVDNVVRELLAQGLTWKTYQEDLPYPGYQGVQYANYVRRHNPLIDFTDACTSTQQLNSVPYTQLAIDMALNQVPNYVYISPNLQDDAHDGTLAQADLWLATQMPAILARPEFQPGGDGLLFITFDEADLSNDNRCSSQILNGCGGHVATLIIGPQVRPGFASPVLYAPSNLLRTVCDGMGLTVCPGAASQSLPMLDVFNTVSVTTPLLNSLVSSHVAVHALAQNSSTVSAMQIYVDSQPVYQTSGATESASLPMSAGKHSVVAQSWDVAGGIHKRQVNVTVQSEAVVVSAPAPNAVVASPVLFTATAGGASTVNAMQIYVDNVSIYQCSGAALNTSVKLNPGPHAVVVQAWDVSGGITKNSFNITVASPAVTIAYPVANSTVYSPVPIVVSTVDPSTVYALQLYVDNVLQYQVTGNGVTWALPMSAGQHTIVAQAWDTAGTVTKQSVVANVVPIPVTIATPVNKSTVSSPVTVQASVPSNTLVYDMQIYVDNILVYDTLGQSVATSLAMTPGTHSLVVQAWDITEGTTQAGITLNVQ